MIILIDVEECWKDSVWSCNKVKEKRRVVLKRKEIIDSNGKNRGNMMVEIRNRECMNLK